MSWARARLGNGHIQDGTTTIAFDQAGDGPPVVLISGGPSDRSWNAPLAGLLAPRFTVFTDDRRGRGDSGDTPPYAVDREYEDLAAVIAQAGGSVALIGYSGTGNIALEAAARGLAVSKLALWEPPFVLQGARPAVPQSVGAAGRGAGVGRSAGRRAGTAHP